MIGGALAGKAAEIGEGCVFSRTLASWELLEEGRDRLDDKTVFVLDEAGLVASKQMATFVEAVTKAGAKLVLVGDPEQPGRSRPAPPSGAFVERIGCRRTRGDPRPEDLDAGGVRSTWSWSDRGRNQSPYAANGKVIGGDLKGEAIAKLIADWDRS